MSNDVLRRWPPQGGTMADLVRAHDWAGTPLGPIDSWPSSLRTAVGIVLAAGQPMLVTWGAELVSIFNDRYLPILGARASGALGRRLPELWPEAWDQVAPLVDSALSGEASWFENQPFVLQRNGYDETAYFTFSFSPLWDDDDARPVGVLATVIETTQQVGAEREHRRLLAETLGSEERLRLAMRSLSLGIWDVDPATTRVQWSDSALRMFGYRTEREIDMVEALRRIHPAERAKVAAAVATALDPESGGTFRQRYRVVWPDGTIRWLESIGQAQFAVRDGVQRAVRLSGVLWDVTEQQQLIETLRDSETRFRAMAEQAEVGIAMADVESRLIYANDRYCQLLSRSRDDTVGRSIEELTHPDDWARTRLLLERAHTQGAPFVIEKRYLRPDGSVIWGRNTVNARRDSDGRVIGSLAVLIEITERVRAEEALRDTDRRKDEFVAMLAHELRNPLAPVRNALALLARETMSDRGRQALDMGQRQLRQIVRLVDDLLEVSRVTRGMIELRPEPVTVQQVIHTAVECVAPSLKERSQRLSLRMPDRPVRLSADPVRLAQIVENLLANASKYTDTGGDIAVCVRAAGDEVAIDVEDTGIGLAPEDLPRLFDLFTQVDTAIDRSRGGLGIGLALVKRLAELHGGSVAARSGGLGKGSIFTVRLPRPAIVDEAAG